jgi:hypothetical protein
MVYNAVCAKSDKVPAERADLLNKKGMESVVRLHPFDHWCVAMQLLFIGGEIASSTHSSNNILIFIAITFGDNYNFFIEIYFGFRYTRYLS